MIQLTGVFSLLLRYKRASKFLLLKEADSIIIDPIKPLYTEIGVYKHEFTSNLLSKKLTLNNNHLQITARN
jgi:hypothetical protein